MGKASGVLGHVLKRQRQKPNGGKGRPVGATQRITVALVEQELARIALFDPISLYKDIASSAGKNGLTTMRMRTLREMPAGVRACIASIKVRTENLTAGDGVQEQVVEVKFWDKLKALELCAKHFGFVSGKTSVVTVEELRGLLEAGRARNAQRRMGPVVDVSPVVGAVAASVPVMAMASEDEVADESL